MLVRLGCCFVLMLWALLPHAARAQDCAEEISKLMMLLGDAKKMTETIVKGM